MFLFQISPRATSKILLCSRAASPSFQLCPIRPLHGRYYSNRLQNWRRSLGYATKASWTNRFEYQPLDSTRREIRLLQPEVQPNTEGGFRDENGRLCFSLHHVSLDEAPLYMSLSYVWGDSRNTNTINLNGSEVEITNNLWRALSKVCGRMTNTNVTFLIWADAICINQLDDVEKSQQVKIMHQIYAGAVFVTAWVGDPPERTQDSKALFYLSWISVELTIATSNMGMEVDGYSTSLPLDDIADFFDSPFWGRIWIVQEMASAKFVAFEYGEKGIHGPSLIGGLRGLNNAIGNHSISRTSPLSLHKPNMMLNISTMKQQHYPIDKLLRMFGANANNLDGFHATDPRDMIFALLNISSDASALGLDANYSMATEEVYSQVTETLIKAGKLGILSLCGMDQSTRGLPSWIPDFSIARTRGIPEVLECFSASGSTRALTSFPDVITPGTIDSQQKILELSGFWVDVILESGRKMQTSHYAMHNLEWVSYMRSWFQDLERFLSRNGISAESIRETGALWRVPIADIEGSLPNPTKGDGADKMQDPTTSFTRATKKTYESYLKFQELLDKSQAADFMGYADVSGLKSVQKLELANGDDFTIGLQNRVARYRKAIWRMGVGYKPFITTRRYIGFGPEEMEEDDIVVIFSGAATPYLIREVKPGFHKIVGACYILGIMDGEFIETNPPLERFLIQ